MSDISFNRVRGAYGPAKLGRSMAADRQCHDPARVPLRFVRPVAIRGGAVFIAVFSLVIVLSTVVVCRAAPSDITSARLTGYSIHHDSRDGGLLILDVPYTKPTFWVFRLEVTCQFRQADGDIDLELPLQSRRVWRRTGRLQMTFPLKDVSELQSRDLLRIVVRYGRASEVCSEWLSVQALLERIHLTLLTSPQWIQRLPQSPRIIARFADTGQPCENGVVTGFLIDDQDREVMTFSQPLEKGGTVSKSLDTSDFAVGLHTLRFNVETPFGVATIEREIELVRRRLLDLDCPATTLTRGSKLTVRATLHDDISMTPLNDEAIEFQIFNAKRVMLDQQNIRTDENGLAVFNLQIPADTEPGTWILMAAHGPEKQHQRLEITAVRSGTERLEIRTDRHLYSIAGNINVRVLSTDGRTGKPLSGKRLVLRLSTTHRLARVFSTSFGKTDAMGAWSGTIDLKPHFKRMNPVEIPHTLLLSVVAKDDRDTTIASSEHIVRLSPDEWDISGRLLEPAICRNVPSRMRVTVLGLDGQPVPTRIRCLDEDRGQIFEGDVPASGSLDFEISIPRVPLNLELICELPGQPRRAIVIDRQTAPIMDLLVRRTMSSGEIAAGGDGELMVFSPLQEGLVYLHLYRDDQIVAASTVDLEAGRAVLPQAFGDEITKWSGAYQTTLSVFQFPRSLTDPRTVLSGWYVVNTENSQERTRWSPRATSDRTAGDRVELAIDGDFILPVREFWIDYFDLDVNGSDFTRSGRGLEAISEHMTETLSKQGGSGRTVVPPSAASPDRFFTRSNTCPQTLRLRLFEREVNERAGRLWKKLPLSRSLDTQLTTEEIQQKELVPQELMMDPWGQPFLIDMPGRLMFSAGADGLAGTEDDIIARGGWHLIQHVPAREKLAHGRAGCAAVIFDARSEPVASAEVMLERSDRGTIVLPQGQDTSHYLDMAIEPGTWNIVIDSPGYERLSIARVPLSPGQIAYVRVALADERYAAAGGVAELDTIAGNAALMQVEEVEAVAESVMTAYRGSERLSASQMMAETVNLDVPGESAYVAGRITPLTQSGFSEPRWFVFHVERELQIDIMPHQLSRLGQKTTSRIPVSNLSDKSLKVSMMHDAPSWLGLTISPSSLTLKPGQSSTMTITANPRQTGSVEINFTLQSAGRRINRSQTWRVSSDRQIERPCSSFILTPGSHDYSALFTPGGGKSGRKAISLDRTCTSFLTGLETILLDEDAGKPDDPTPLTLNLLTRMMIDSTRLVLLKRMSSENDENLTDATQLTIDEALLKLQGQYRRLLTMQIRDGGFNRRDGEREDAVITAIAMRLLGRLKHHMPIDPAVIRQTRYWLLVNQNMHGLWTTNERENAFIVMSLAELETGIENAVRTMTWYTRPATMAQDRIARIFLARTARRIQPYLPEEVHTTIAQWNAGTFTRTPGEKLLLASLTRADSAAACPSGHIASSHDWLTIHADSETTPLVWEILASLLDCAGELPPVASPLTMTIAASGLDDMTHVFDPRDPGSLAWEIVNVSPPLTITSDAARPVFMNLCQ